MKDRSVEFPNRYKLIKVTGTDDIYDLLPAPGTVEEVGTEINKTNMLTDSTAQKFGLDSNAVPDDAFSKTVSFINHGWRLFQCWKTAGSYEWTVPDLFGDVSAYVIGVVVVGGGGSGSLGAYISTDSDTTFSYYMCGGSSGYAAFRVMEVTPGNVCTLVVGAGGPAIVAVGGTTMWLLEDGKAGGSSSFEGVIANGGGGGAADTRYPTPNSGGQVAIHGNSSATIPYGGIVTETTRLDPGMGRNPFTGEVLLAAGGSAYLHSTKSGTVEVSAPNGVPILEEGLVSAGVAITKAPTNRADKAIAGTIPGCGGGAITAARYGASVTGYTLESAPGADGAVLIYVQGVEL